MRNYDHSSKYDIEEAAKIKAEPWQLDLLAMNPSYTCWGPFEDYMSNEGSGWDRRQLFDTWSDFGPWKLDDLNEVVNFYFSVNREAKDCETCEGTGLTEQANQLSRDFHNGWSKHLVQDEVDALWEEGRLHYKFKEKPTAEQVNEWAINARGLGHDATNRCVCPDARTKRLGIEKHCPVCGGDGYIYTSEVAHVSLTLWILHPRKGCSRGVEVANIQRSELPAVFAYLREAADRNANRFSKIPTGE